MRLLTVLLLASLASAAPAVLPVPELFPSSHPRKDQVSKEDLAKEVFISTEELVSEENPMKEPTKPKSQKLKVPNTASREDQDMNTELQTEATTELPAITATTSERKLAKLSHKIGKDLDQTVKGILNYLGNLVPDAGIMKL
ncbi:glycosylation-dependent cell adhesion molecule 1-like [Ochotona princeps]|uniref:glycosylation-dependent cell adhesion molecule 1-like n=1 Tax=Ochotona princeps TaxID=9978 RepID=UPI002714D9A0|nr:glycosylation-dependent cell adhesion molecule 1-like [Ochotona princeps]